MLYREPMWLKLERAKKEIDRAHVSVLYREPMWLKWLTEVSLKIERKVSVLYREPMWLKSKSQAYVKQMIAGFSALP